MLYDNNFSSENLDRRVAGPWSVVLWADEKHVVREVTRQIRDSIRVQWKAAAYMVREMEDQASQTFAILMMVPDLIAGPQMPSDNCRPC